MGHEHSAAFWSWQLITAIVLNCVIQCVTIGGYASRLAGAVSGRVAMAISLFNIFVMTGRLASMIYTPILGSLSDNAGFSVVTSQAHTFAVHQFEWQLRWIVLGGTVGTALGALFFPTFVMLYLRAIGAFERLGNLPRAMARVLVPKTIVSVLRTMRLASPASIFRLSLRNVPKDALVLNVVVTSIYGIGVVSAAYASVLNPAAARTALLSSGLINGLATIAYNVIVDPASAFVTDQAVRGERSIDDVKSFVAYLAMTATLGFVLSQLLLVPAAIVIEGAARVVSGR